VIFGACDVLFNAFTLYPHIPAGNCVKFGTPLSVANVPKVFPVELPGIVTVTTCSAAPDVNVDICL